MTCRRSASPARPWLDKTSGEHQDVHRAERGGINQVEAGVRDRAANRAAILLAPPVTRAKTFFTFVGQRNSRLHLCLSRTWESYATGLSDAFSLPCIDGIIRPNRRHLRTQ